MKSDHYLIAAAVVSLVWSLRSEAHDSLQALNQGGNIAQLTAAALHPLREMPQLLALAAAIIGGLLWFVGRHRAKHKKPAINFAPTASKLVAVRHDASPRR